MVPNPLPLTSIVPVLKLLRELLKPKGVYCNPIKMISIKSAYADGISTFVLSLRYTVWRIFIFKILKMVLQNLYLYFTHPLTL